jgi:predicted acetyltransferase
MAMTNEERVVLENLFQLYVHDWSEILPLEVGDDGRFTTRALDPYVRRDDGRHAFLLRADGQLAGFVLIAEQSRLTGATGVCDLAELFVMRGHRRRGVGRAAAFAAFDRFPGLWEVRQRDQNPAAITFWRRVIAEYTSGRYEERRWDDATWVGPVQTFSTTDRAI